MRLTALLFKKRKFPRGNIYTGKYRLVKEVDMKSLRYLQNDYDREERNMLILRHPYLTVEQSHGHMKALRPPHNYKAICETKIIEKFNKVTTLEDRLMHLKVKDAWD